MKKHNSIAMKEQRNAIDFLHSTRDLINLKNKRIDSVIKFVIARKAVPLISDKVFFIDRNIASQ